MPGDKGKSAQVGFSYFRLAEHAGRLGYWRLDPADGQTFWSDGLYRLFDIDPGVGHPDLDTLLAPMRSEDARHLRACIAAAAKTGAPFACRMRARDTDKPVRIFDAHGEAVLDSHGDTVAIEGVLRDVTAEVSAETARETLHSQYSVMAEEASDIIVLHENGEVVCASNALWRLLKRTPDEMRGSRYLELVHPDDLDEAHKIIGQPPPGEIWTGTYRVRHADGHYIWFEVTTRGVYDENTGAFRREISVGRDVTERKRQELQTRTAQERAEAANRAKSRFLAHMSHELRTPLNAIMGFSDIMRRNMLGDGKPNAEYAQLIYDSAELLLGHIAGILEMANIEGGKIALAPEPLLLRNLLDDGVRLVRDSADRKDLTLTLDCTPSLSLRADKRAVEQILRHLLSNAVKFTLRGGHIRIGAEQSRASTTLFVKDDGMGIPAEELPRLGRAFEQATADPLIAKGGAGTGLGLALVRSLVERHGGQLRIESALGEGTGVFVEFPLEAQEHAACRGDVWSPM